MNGEGFWACVAPQAQCVRGYQQAVYLPHKCHDCPMAKRVTADATGLAKSVNGTTLNPNEQQAIRRLSK